MRNRNKKYEDEIWGDEEPFAPTTLRERNKQGEEFNWLQESHNLAAQLRGISQGLGRLSSAFHAVGNDKISGELEHLSIMVAVAGEDSSFLTGYKVNKDYTESIQNTGSILSALVGGIKLAGADELARTAESAFGTDVLGDKADSAAVAEEP